MKSILLYCFLFVFSFGFSQTPCNSGMAGDYPCNKYDLQSRLPLTDFSANSGNDSWGWTDSLDGKEYALMGLNNGTAFIDVSDPLNPIYLGKLPTHTNSSQWRDVKVYGDHAFVVSEASGHGMQVFDLTRLRDVTNPPVTFNEDAHYNGFSNAHNIVINEEQPYAYGVGTNTFSGGAHFVDISDPLNPVAAGGYGNDGYTHDAQVVTYSGPDPDYQGAEIYVGSNEDEVVFVDVSVKSNPQGISEVNYTNAGYTHQGWFTEDQRYFIVGDELDEVVFGFPTRLIILDVTDLDNPTVHFEYTGTTDASDHNLYVKGDLLYLANYRGGMRVYDISDIENQNMNEIGFFDTWPANDNVGASVGDPGAWNVYPYFDSDNILITNYSDNGGFFLVKEETLGVVSNDLLGFSVYPNPSKGLVSITSEENVISEIAVFDSFGKLLIAQRNLNGLQHTLDLSAFAQGMYLLRVNGKTVQKLLKE